jgi:hypothetical protein
MLSGQCFVFLFRQRTERPHQSDVNTRVAIPNTTKEVRNQIILDPEIPEILLPCMETVEVGGYLIVWL